MSEVIVEKLWGRERVLHNGPDYCCKILELERFVQSSLHMHKQKRETFVVMDGIVALERSDGPVQYLQTGEWITIEPLVLHRFRSVTSTSTVMEASSQHSDDDVFRTEESRKL